jgi:hypothetical protein
MEYMDALDYDNEEEANQKVEILLSGYEVFKNAFQRDSHSFIAPCYRWDDQVEKTLQKMNVHFIQGQRKQLKPILGQGFKFKPQPHFTGEQNKNSQIYMARNVFFEPSTDPDKGWVKSAMGDISLAFLLNEPAIISSHRLNFLGRLSKTNRAFNLRLFHQLLQEIVFKFPDVEFMSSDELGFLIKNEKK